MNINPTRYILTVKPKEGKPYNPVHDDIQGSVCSILDIEVGQRGWIMVWSDYDGWHRVHTSTVESIEPHPIKDEGWMITTRNTVYFFEEFEENT